MKKIFKLIIKAIDGILYGFIGPFSVLYIIPQFLMNIFNSLLLPKFNINWLEQTGKYLTWFGAGLAIYCSVQMLFTGKGSPFVTSPPDKLLYKGIYKFVRHPMMWALIIVLFGEILLFGSCILIIWLLAWLRIGHLIVVNYEEPQLERRYGKIYIEYCKNTPRWFPNFKKAKYIGKG